MSDSHEPRPPIISLQQRRALEQAVQALAETTTEFGLLNAAEQIAAGWPLADVLHVLVKYLDTPSAQMRGGLARLAALLPADETAAALRAVAGNRAAAPQARQTAALILERFLEAPVPPGLLADLQASDNSGEASLREAVDEGRTNPHVLLEYVTQMQAYGEEIAHQVMHHLGTFPAADQVGLLRLIAFDARPRVAQAALRRLEALAEPPASEPAALRALHSLQFTLAPEAAAGVERALRKLQFRGFRYTPPEPTGWRALLASAEPAGRQWLWLLRMPDAGNADGLLVGVLLHPEAGILYTTVAENVDAVLLPAAAPLGARVALSGDGAATAHEVEAPFDLGRALLRLALAPHWDARARRPLSGELLLLHERLWSFAPPALPADAAALLERPAEPAPLADAETLVETLLAEPVMRDWVAPLRVETVGARLPAGLPRADVARWMVRALADSPARDEMVAALAAGLWMQSLWLWAAGRPAAAQAAHRLAASFPVWPLEQNPLMVALVAAAMEEE